MRRSIPPYNGKRYLLNLGTGEIHDLDNETTQCHIDDIKPEHVYNCESYTAAEIWAVMSNIYKSNGCHYCNCSRDNG